MLIVGELINGMYKKVGEAIRLKDQKFIQELALKQVDNGATALDLNCGPLSKDPVSDMRWLVETVQNATPAILCLDSTKLKAIEEGLKISKNKTMINSANAEEDKLKALIPMASNFDSLLIALAMDKKGIPQNKDQRIELAAKILESAVNMNFDIQNLYLDPVLMPINVAQGQEKEILESLREFKLLAEPPVKTIIGLSNVSQGAKLRGLINRTFLVMAVSLSLDAAILDPLDRELIGSLTCAELILNKHIYCDSFLNTYKK
jgi:5-methyltetrahydrofolate corrinoid/iron sulfur protein methyltransferase